MPKPKLTLAAVASAALIALTGCSPPQGPAGTVVGKHHTYWPATKRWRYKLTTRDNAGVEHTFRVTKGDYAACYRGSSYPHCTEVH